MIIKLTGAAATYITLSGVSTRVEENQQVNISDGDWAAVPSAEKAYFTIVRDDTLEGRVSAVESTDTAQGTATEALDTAMDAVDAAATASTAATNVSQPAPTAATQADAVDDATVWALANELKAKYNIAVTAIVELRAKHDLMTAEVNALRTALAAQGD